MAIMFSTGMLFSRYLNSNLFTFKNTAMIRNPCIRLNNLYSSTAFGDFFESSFTAPNSKVPIFPAGRAWDPDELRQKSFSDLHKLWFVLIKELNLLSTQRLESNRWGTNDLSSTRIHKCRLSMARIKSVLSERMTLYSTASKITSNEAEFSWPADILKEHREKQARSIRRYRKRLAYYKGKQPLLS